MWGAISLWFWVGFPWWLVMLNIFSCICCHLYVFLGKMSVQFLCTFYIELFSFLPVVWVPHIFRVLTPYQIYDLQIFFFPFCRMLFHFVSFIVQKLLAWCSHTYCFLLFVLVFNVISKKLLPDLMSRSLSLISSQCFMIWVLHSNL